MLFLQIFLFFSQIFFFFAKEKYQLFKILILSIYLKIIEIDDDLSILNYLIIKKLYRNQFNDKI